MKFVALFLVAYLAIASALSAVTYSNTNVTLNNANGEFNFRFTTFNGFGVLGFNGVNYASLSGNANQNQADLNGVFGAVYTNPLVPPFAYLSFFDIAAQFSLVGNNGATADVNASAAFVCSSFLNLDEVDPSGNVAQTIQLKSLIYTIDKSSFGTGGLRFVSFKGLKLIPDAFSVTLTFVASDVVGVLNVPGSPIVTPKSVEVIIEIDNFPYTNNANSVRLNIGTGSAAGAANINANAVTMSSGSGNQAIYYQLNNQAQVNGVLKPCTVSKFVAGTANAIIQNNDAIAQINAKYGAAASFQLVSVTFPAGASQILYDPSLGVGTAPQNAGAYFLAPSMLLMAIFAFIAMF